MSNILRPSKSEIEIRRMTANTVRQSYYNLAEDYNRVINGEYAVCAKCGSWMKTDQFFYKDASCATGYFPICKECLAKMAERRVNDDDPPAPTKESVKRALMMMNRPFIEKIYDKCVKEFEQNNTKFRSVFTMYVSNIARNVDLTWEDSQFNASYGGEETYDDDDTALIEEAKKRFGDTYSPSDLIFLETEYQDWIKRYSCENKAQEILYKNIAYTQLNIEKEQRMGGETKDLVKTLQELMSSLQIKPSQANSNALTEAKTFGQLIEKWEDEYKGGRPIPEPDEDFKDVNKIGKLINVFFKGHLAKMMGLKNAFSSEYDKYMAKYTVTPSEDEEESDSDAIFDQIFGGMDDE